MELVELVLALQALESALRNYKLLRDLRRTKPEQS